MEDGLLTGILEPPSNPTLTGRMALPTVGYQPTPWKVDRVWEGVFPDSLCCDA